MSAAEVPTGERSIKEKQEAYHDWEASNYDDKFSISYDERTIAYAADRYLKAIPEGTTFDHVLEVGAGTGFFSINLWQAGYLGEDLHATDISSKMLDVYQRNARSVGLDVETTPGDIEALPYPDGRFDLVIGHAFLHHIPDVPAALREVHRVLRPGGTLVICGEPTLWGDRILQRIKRGTYLAHRGVTTMPLLRSWRKPSSSERHTGEDADVAALEWEVDLHTFDPSEVERWTLDAGFADVDVRTEDLTAAWFGWAVRTIEGTTADGKLGAGWAFWAYRNYLRLQKLDERLLTHVVPRDLFYNLIVRADKAS